MLLVFCVATLLTPLDFAAAAPRTSIPPPYIEVDSGTRTALRERGTKRPFVAVGVNYFDPQVGWAPKLWQRFDESRVRRHLDLIHEAGFNTIRVFLTYASFHSEKGKVNEAGLKKLHTLLGLCRERGIYVIPTGPDHWEGVPTWFTGDRFADEEMLASDDAWWSAFAREMRDEPTILAYDLLNEPSVGWDTPAMRQRWGKGWRKYLEAKSLSRGGTYGDQIRGRGLASKPTTGTEESAATVPASIDEAELAIPSPLPTDDPAQQSRLRAFQSLRQGLADEWTRRKVAAIRSVDRNHLITVGHIQWAAPILLPAVQHYAGFNLKENARHVDFVTIHFYPLDWPKPCDTAEGVAVNAAYLQAVLFQADAGKPIMLGEFGWHGGGPIIRNGQVDLPEQSPQQQLEWCREAVAVSRGRVCGWLNWAMADTPESTDLTRWSGCWTTDLQIKPWGDWFGDFAKEQSRRPDAPRPWPEFMSIAGVGLDGMKLSPKVGNNVRLQLRAAMSRPVD
jgi:hypothetical protein